MTPGMTIFLVLCIAIWMLVRKNTVGAWDELRLWAAYPKALYYTERLQLGSEAMLFSNMQSYLPGMALFSYLIQKISGSFHTGRLTWAYGVFCIMLALPVTRNLRWKRPAMIFVTLIGLFTIQMYFGNTNDIAAYRSLMIDAVLGVSFGCAVWYASKIASGNWLDLLRLTSVVFLTALLKDSGAILAFGAAAAALLFLYCDLQQTALPKRTFFCQAGVLLFVPLAAVFVWRMLLVKNGVVNHIAMEHSADIGDFIKRYIHTLLKTDIVASPVFAKWGGPELATYATTGALCAAMGILGCSLLSDSQRSAQKRALITMAVMNAAYVIGLGILFLRGFSGQLPSYERYIATIAQANIVVILLGFFQMSQEDAECGLLRNEWTKLGLAVSVTAIVAVFSFCLYRSSAEDAIVAETRAAEIAEQIAAEELTSEKTTDIYLVFPRGEIDLMHHRLYYELIDYNIRVINYYDNTTVNRGAGATQEMIDEVRQQFVKTIVETGCNYVYFVEDVPLASEQLPDLFDGGTEAGAIYRIESVASQGAVLCRVAAN